MAEDVPHIPQYPRKPAKLGLVTKREEEDPGFATRKLGRSGNQIAGAPRITRPGAARRRRAGRWALPLPNLYRRWPRDWDWAAQIRWAAWRIS